MNVDLVLVITNFNKDKFKEELLKFVFKSIDQNLSWINHIYIVTKSIDDLPIWLDLTKISILTYDFLIDYTSLSEVLDKIEPFIATVNEISSNYIVLYDTTFILQPLKKEDFFDSTSNKPIYNSSMYLTKETSPRLTKITNGYLKFNNKVELPCLIKRPFYGVVPTNKNLWRELLDKMPELYSSNSYSSEIIFEYGKKHNKIKLRNKPWSEGLFHYNPGWAGIINYDLLNNSYRIIMSITNELTSYRHMPIQFGPQTRKLILEGLEYRLGKKSSIYELK